LPGQALIEDLEESQWLRAADHTTGRHIVQRTPLLCVEKIAASDLTLTEDRNGDGREGQNVIDPENLPTAPGSRDKQRTMRVGIREQLALLVLLTSMVALAVVSIATVRLPN
jgi:hypothetical protein